MKASAPGKLFLIGEYAVLEGAPAILTPIPQRAEAALSKADDGVGSGMVTTIDHETRRLTADIALDTLPLLRAVVETLDCAEVIHNNNLTLDTAAFFRRGIKLGLGSSAALTAALVKLLSADQDLTTSELIALAQQCHRRFQDGRGSGADIALSMSDTSIIHQAGAPAQPVALPPDLRMLAIWTGEAASTTGYLQAMEQWRAQHESGFRHHMAQLHETATQAVAAIQGGDTEQVLSTIACFDLQLEQLSRDSGLDFYNQTHLEMRKRVELADCTYKPSGAGGGDFGIAYCVNQNSHQASEQIRNQIRNQSADNNPLNQLAEELARENFHCIFLDAVATSFQE